MIFDYNIGNTPIQLKGLEIFPQLTSLDFFVSEITFDPNDKWLSRIENISLEKSRINGMTSFFIFPNLKKLDIGFGGFDPFPKDIETLAHLEDISLAAYNLGSVVDLKTIDLSKFKSLKLARVHMYYDTFVGIPSGIETNPNKIYLEVYHQKLTAEQKSKVKRFNQGIKPRK